VLAGRGIVDTDGRCGMSLWGTSTGEGGHSCPPPYKNPTGFNESEPISIKANNSDLSLEWLDGTDLSVGWKVDGWSVARLTESAIPIEFGIHSVYPNPFNGQLRVDFGLNKSSNITIKAYDLTGREAATLVSAQYNKGAYRIHWNADDLPSGLYLLQLKTSERTQTRKVLLIR
ncbi:MAG: T9SS type A sorting domain-containing protein, partial [Candidatus Hatepunaea meridiana]|nr:T9SS type A sorting domain-containing protein [Candidatus Hatepunaea meridiana]